MMEPPLGGFLRSVLSALEAPINVSKPQVMTLIAAVAEVSVLVVHLTRLHHSQFTSASP